MHTWDIDVWDVQPVGCVGYIPQLYNCGMYSSACGTLYNLTCPGHLTGIFYITVHTNLQPLAFITITQPLCAWASHSD